MKRVTAFVGSARKRLTDYTVCRFMDKLQSLGEIECEIITLSDHRLETCKGCCVCFKKGEEFCPLKDDRDMLFDRIMTSDGVVFATPNYSFHASAITKIFLDRFGFIFHRPRFFGKTFTSIVAQGIYGGDKIVSYLDFVGGGLGFNTVKGCCVTAFDPMTEKNKRKIDRAVAELSRRFYKTFMQPAYPVPTYLKLCSFRMARTSMGLLLDDSSRDYTYYKKMGWFKSDYYYPTRLGPLKKAAGSLFDSIARSISKKRAGIVTSNP
jgi:multimeric flavodoxin WrbA